MGGVKREDRRDLIIGFAALMMVMVAHALGETARDTLFLTGLPAERLPWAYLTIAGLALIVVRANQWVLDRVRDKRRLLTGTMLTAAGVDGLFWWWLEGDPHGRAFALYVWIGLFATITVVQLWLLLDDVVHVGKAKRIFGPIAAGGVFGAVVGSGIAERLLDAGLQPRHLMLAAGISLVIGAAIPMQWRPSELEGHGTEPALPTDVVHGFRTLCGHLYLRRLLLLVLVSTIALTGVDYVFKSAVDQHVAQEDLGTFFARFYLALNGIALVVQLFLSGRLLRMIGVSRTLFVLPVLLLAATIGFVVVPALLPALLLKASDGSLRHSLHRTATEVLYLPVGRDLRERFKAIIDGVGQRGGQALASLAILVALWLGADLKIVAGAVAGLLVLWLVIAMALKAPYLALFRQSLRGGMVDLNVANLELDLHGLEGLLGALNSERDEEVRVAIELFEHHDRIDLLPKLILYHPSKEVALRALEAFARHGDESFVPIARRLMQQGDPDVRAGALRAIAGVAPHPDLLSRALQDESPAVQATAVIGLVSGGYGDREELQRTLSRTMMEGSEEVRARLAQAIRHSGDPQFGDRLDVLLADSAVSVRREAAHAVAAIPDARFIPTLVSMLDDAALRPAARKALVAIGSPALDFLERALGDETVSRKVRRHVPRTILHFTPKRALEVLQSRLEAETDGAVRYKILRAMGRLRANDPKLSLDEPLVRRFQRRTLERIAQLTHYRTTLERGQRHDEARRTTGGELLVASLREKEVNALERVFRLQHILRPVDSYQLYWRGLQSRDHAHRAASRELVEHSFDGPARDAVLAFAEEGKASERAAMAAKALNVDLASLEYEQVLETLIADASEAIRSLTAYHIAELGLTALEPQLEASQPEPGSVVAEVVDRALAALRGGEVPSVA